MHNKYAFFSAIILLSCLKFLLSIMKCGVVIRPADVVYKFICHSHSTNK